MGRLRFIALLFATLATSAGAKELWERSWIEVRSPHFVIVSAISENATVDLSRDLECFRTAVQIITNIGRFEERIPTRVYVLPQAVEKLGFKRGIGGYFMPEMRANYAAVTRASGLAIDDVLKHEYVHFLLHNRDAKGYPTWFEEGFAEALSTLIARGNSITYGEPNPGRLAWLANAPWMPFQRLLDTRDVTTLRDDRIRMFYAQSWLLMHYLMHGRRPEQTFSNDATVYLHLVETGVTSSDAFEQAFDLPLSKLRTTLSAHLDGKLRVLRLRLAEPLPDAPVQVIAVPADSIAAQLGDLSMVLDEWGEAQRYWNTAMALNPNNAKALVGLGDLHKLAGRFDEAEPYYEKAISLEPQNAYHELDYGEYFLERAYTAKNPADVAHDLGEARRHLSRSYDLDAGDPETLKANGESYLFPGESLDTAIQSLNAAHELLPSQPEIKYWLARAYAMRGNLDEANALLRSLIAWSPHGTAESATRLLAQLSNAQHLDRATSEEPPPAEVKIR